MGLISGSRITLSDWIFVVVRIYIVYLLMSRLGFVFGLLIYLILQWLQVQTTARMLNLESLQPVDINALNDGPENVSNIMAAFVFHEKCEPEMIREVFIEKLSMQYRRYRSSLVKVADSYYFKEMETKELRKALDAAFIIREDITNKEDFALLCQEQQTYMFPEHGLQWAIYFCPNYEDNQSLMMLKVHHVLGDGLGLLFVFATLQDSYDANQFIQTTSVISTL